MKITEKMIDYISELSRLELSPQERESAGKNLTDILNYMEQLNGLDTEGVEELTHPCDQGNRFRPEEGVNGDQRAAMLQNAPDTRDGYFKVFKTVE